MDWQHVEKSWQPYSDRAKERWSKLTDDKLKSIEGRRPALIEAVREAYSVDNATAEKQVSDWQNGLQEFGEGNYAAAREYDDATRKFVASGKVEDAARAAKPRNDQEASEMSAAEREGKSHAKGEDPALRRKSSGDAK